MRLQEHRETSPGGIVLVILLVGLGLRCAALTFGLPALYHADEPIVINHALAFGSGDLNPHFFRIPPLVSYALFGCFGFYYVLGALLGSFESLTAFEVLFYSDPSTFYLIGRIMAGVIPGTLTLYLLYRLVRHFQNAGSAVCAMFFLALAFLHVRDSHYAYVDMTLLFWLVVSFFFIAKVSEEGDVGLFHVLAGISIGIAAAVKYNGAVLGIPYLFASLYKNEGRSPLGGWIACGAGALGAFFLLNPFALIDWRFFLQELAQEGAAHPGGMPWYHHLVYSLAGGMGWPLLITGILGILTLAGRSGFYFCMASFVVGYYGVLVFAGQPYDRYVLPIIPFLAAFAGSFVWTATEGLAKGFRPVAAGLLCLLLVWIPIRQSVLWIRVMMQKDVRTEARDWIEEYLPPGSRIAEGSSFYLPRLSFTEEQLENKLEAARQSNTFSQARARKLDFLLTVEQVNQKGYELFFLSSDPDRAPVFSLDGPRIGYDLDELKKRGIEYVLIPRTREHMEPAAFYERLQQEGRLIRRFTPYRDENRRWPYDEQPLTGGPFLMRELTARRANGIPIEIYSLEAS